MSESLNNAKMSDLSDKIDAQEVARKATLEKSKKVAKKLGKKK